MYQIVSAQAIAKGNYGDWAPVKLSGMTMNDIFLKYSLCLLQLHDQEKDITGWIDIYSFPVVVRTSPMTIDQWLNVAVGLNLLEDDPFGVKGDNYVRFIFANAFGMKVKGINFNFSTEEELLPDQQIDIKLYKDGISDYSNIVNHSLFTANGLIFRSDTLSGGGIAMIGAGLCVSKYNDNRFGILDFSGIGSLKSYSITDAMIHGGGSSTPLSRGFFIDVPEDLNGKTVALVLAGKLHILDGAINVVGDSRIRVNSQLIDFPDLYYSTYDSLDLSSLPLTVDQTATDQFVTSQFTNDATIKAFFQLSQSFLVVINSGNLVVENLGIKTTNIAGLYLSPGSDQPDLPLQVGSGYLAEYNLEERDGFWALSVPRHYYKFWIRHSTSVTDATIIRDQLFGYHPVTKSRAGFLLIKKVASL